jgi:hypothetical protein
VPPEPGSSGPGSDDRDGNGEDERAERFADLVGDDLGVVDGGQHRGAQEAATITTIGGGRSRPQVRISAATARTGRYRIVSSFARWGAG